MITYKEVRCLAKKYAEKSVVITPNPKVIANPLTGPDPRKKSIIADIRVVIFASNIAVCAFL